MMEYDDSKEIDSGSGDRELAQTITTPEHIFGRSSVTSLDIKYSNDSTLTLISNPKEENVDRDKNQNRMMQLIGNGTEPHEKSNSTTSSKLEGEEIKGI